MARSGSRLLAAAVAGVLLLPCAARAATEVVLHDFFGILDGEFPQGGVTLDQAGNIYGTTSTYGEGVYGTVYMLTPSGAETVLAYLDSTDGSNAVAPPVLDAAAPGMLFGTASTGGPGTPAGTLGNGVVYAQSAVTPSGETVLHGFRGGADGAGPASRLVVDEAGNLYGTTTDTRGQDGTVFELTRRMQYKIVHSFTGPDGDGPVGALCLGPDGTLYGVTSYGGRYGFGTLYAIAPGGVLSTLYSFPALTVPNGGLVRDPAGNLYGFTQIGGKYGGGTLYRLSASGVLTVLHAFGAPGDGVGPTGAPVANASGTVFGATTYGGAAGEGSVFAMTKTGVETILYSFGTAFNDGAYPVLTGGGLAIDAAGALYGTTASGGGATSGVVFKVIP